MTMKRTELAKNKLIKASHAVKIASVPDRFGTGSGTFDRKEQRKLDQAAGLIPFACKLPNELVKQLHARVAAEQSNMNDFVAGLLDKALGSAAAVVKTMPPVEKVAAAAVVAKVASAPKAVKVAAKVEVAGKVAKAAKVATVAKTAKTRK